MPKYEEGCYADGSCGPDHCTRKVFDIAENEGWRNQLDREEYRVYLKFLENETLSEDQYEILQYIEECALEFLNDDCSDEGYYWGYENGNFGYWRIGE